MKFLNFKWIKFEIYGWILILQQYVLMFITKRFLNQKSLFLIKTIFGEWFINLYAKTIENLSNYMKYGNESGLQKISDEFWG